MRGCPSCLPLVMLFTIYFGPKKLVIASSLPANPTEAKEIVTIPFYKQTDIEGAILQVRQHGTVYLLNPEPQQVLEQVKDYFSFIQAAGGLVQNAEKQVLLIFRKGKWDLPKGKLDPGEDLPTCAVREVEEETGVAQLTINRPLSPTYHTYFMDGRHCLKESHWYLMQTLHSGPLQPQLEEDIEQCIWCEPHELPNYLHNTHPSIADVIREATPLL